MALQTAAAVNDAAINLNPDGRQALDKFQRAVAIGRR